MLFVLTVYSFRWAFSDCFERYFKCLNRPSFIRRILITCSKRKKEDLRLSLYCYFYSPGSIHRFFFHSLTSWLRFVTPTTGKKNSCRDKWGCRIIFKVGEQKRANRLKLKYQTDGWTTVAVGLCFSLYANCKENVKIAQRRSQTAKAHVSCISCIYELRTCEVR